MEVRELIEIIEGNFHRYYQLLHRLEEDPDFMEIAQETPHFRELLQTLADIQDEVVDFRLKKIILEEHPYLPQIQVDKLKQQGSHSRLPLRQVVQNFLQQRRALLKLLHALPTENWERTGVHEIEGHVSFKELVRRMAEKDQKVLNELRKAVSPLIAS